MERKIAMSNTTNEQDRKESSKTKNLSKKIHEKKNRSRRFLS